MAIVLAKLLLSPLCVVAVSLAGRRWGVAVAGVLGGLPVVAGPILLVLTLVHGRQFGAEAAAGTLLGLAALTLFVVVYGRASERFGPPPSVLAGWAAFLSGHRLSTAAQPAARRLADRRRDWLRCGLGLASGSLGSPNRCRGATLLGPAGTSTCRPGLGRRARRQPGLARRPRRVLGSVDSGARGAGDDLRGAVTPLVAAARRG